MQSDERLVGQCLSGDASAFEALLQRYQKPAFSLVLRMVRDPEDARDVTQTAFLKAYEALGSFDPKYKFSTWLFRIAVNESLNLLQRRRPTEPIDEEPLSKDPGPADALRCSELSRAVQDALMALSPELRSVVVLRHFLGCTYGEIALAVGAPEKTVKSRLFSARQRLRALLQTRGVVRP